MTHQLFNFIKAVIFLAILGHTIQQGQNQYQQPQQGQYQQPQQGQYQQPQQAQYQQPQQGQFQQPQQGQYQQPQQGQHQQPQQGQHQQPSQAQYQQAQQPPPQQPQRSLALRKFEYKHSFKGPNLSQKDGTIPFWEISGDAIASSEQLRLAPSIRSKKGMAWNVRPFTETDFWDVEIDFRVTGQGRIGADGLAFWYTASKGTVGPVFGANNYWVGLGVFFDSFDNDAQRNNPYIMAMLNDGTKVYDHNTDGSSQQLAGCHKDFRNRPFPVKVKIEYFKNVLTIMVHDGLTQQERYELCLRAENVFLPKNGYFGLSAATGGLADDHDIIACLISSLKSPEQAKPPSMQIPDNEKQKYEEDFEKFWREFEQEREKFAKEHPDKAKPKEPDVARLYEDTTERELRLIYEGQNAIHNVMTQLDAKLNQLVQQQQQNTLMITTIAQQKGVQPVAVQQPGQQRPAPSGADTIQRHEVNEVMQLTREMHAYLRDVKTFVMDIQAKTNALEQRSQMGQGHVQPIGGGGGGGPDQFQFNAVKTYLEGIKHDVEQLRINQRAPGLKDCPQVETNCLNATLFFIVAAAQCVVFVMFSMLKRNDKAKFY